MDTHLKSCKKSSKIKETKGPKVPNNIQRLGHTFVQKVDEFEFKGVAECALVLYVYFILIEYLIINIKSLGVG